VIEHRQMRQPRPYDRFCRATSAFRPPEGVLAARVAQLAAGATHVFARMRQKDLSQALRIVKKAMPIVDWARLFSGGLHDRR
jgi:hypothetical protein